MAAHLAPDTAVTLRPVLPEDEPYLYTLYATTREKEMAVTAWDEAQKATFLQQQHQSQLAHYAQRFPDAEHSLILVDEQAVGRIYVNRTAAEIRLLDITIAPEHRNQGIGTALMHTLLTEAKNAGVPLRLYVWQLNFDARRWYEKLGFRQIGSIEVYHHLEWQPV